MPAIVLGTGLRWRVSLVLGAAVVAASTTGQAALDRTAQLAYVRAAGAEDCPDEQTIRAGVADRLGYEPFDGRAARHVSAVLARAGQTLEAKIELGDGNGGIQARRKLVSRQRDCTELAAAVELAIAIAIDPMGREKKGRPVATAEPPPVAPAPDSTGASSAWEIIEVRAAPQPVPPAGGPPPVPVVLQAAVGAQGAFGIAPASALGGAVQVAARRGSLSIGIEGRADLPAAAALRTGSVTTSLLEASLVPCGHHGVFAACLLVSGGVMRASGRGLVDAQPATLPHAALGARLALEIPLGSAIFVDLHGDAVAPLMQSVLRVSGETVWTSPSLSIACGGGLGARFP